MSSEKSTLEAIAIVVAVLFVLGIVVVVLSTTFFTGYAEPAHVSSGGEAYSPPSQAYTAGPSFHVFNYFNSAALMVMVVVGLIVAVVIANALYQKTKSFRASVLYIIGTLFLFASVTILLFGIHDILTFSGVGETFEQPTIMQQYGWIIESFVFGVFGIAFVVAGEKIRKMEGEEQSLTYLAVTPIATVFALFAIPALLFGFHNALYTSSSAQSFAWVIETLAFGGIGVLLFNWIDKKRQESGETGLWKIYPLYALAWMGYVLIIPALFLFILTTHTYLTGSSVRDLWKPLVETLVFTLVGFVSLYGIDRLSGKAFRPRLSHILLPMGVVFALAAVLMLVVGFTTFLKADITAGNYRESFSWAIEVLLFGLIAYASLVYNDRIAKQGSPFSDSLRQVLSVCGILLWLTSLMFFFYTVNTFVFDQSPELRYPAAFIFHGLVSLGLIYYSDKLRRGEGVMKHALLAKAFLLAGGLLLVAALPLFVADLHTFLYSKSPDARPIIKDLAYAIVGGLYLFISYSLKPITFEKKKSKPEEKAAGERMQQLDLKVENQSLKTNTKRRTL